MALASESLPTISISSVHSHEPFGLESRTETSKDRSRNSFRKIEITIPLIMRMKYVEEIHYLK